VYLYFSLGIWVSTQRDQYQKGTLSEDSIEKLDKIGFTWDSYQYKFDSRLSQLIEYKDLSGDCNVPKKYDSNPGE